MHVHSNSGGEPTSTAPHRIGFYHTEKHEYTDTHTNTYIGIVHVSVAHFFFTVICLVAW